MHSSSSPPASGAKRPWLKSRRALIAALLAGGFGCILFACWLLVQEVSWKAQLRSYLPQDAHNVQFGGFTALLTIEGVCTFSSSPAELDKLVSSPGFIDITNELATPDGQWWRAHLSDVARRHLGQSLESLGPVRVYQKNLREINDITEDIVVVETVARDKALLYYLYQQ